MLRQQKLRDTGECSRPAPKTILDLPEHVRRRIYLYCGLFSHKKVILAPQGRPHNPFAQYYPVQFHLFYTCKAIRDETTAIFFSENHFVVPYSHIDKGLRFLQQLPLKAISKLSWLCVHLHVEPSQNSWPDLVEDYYDSFFETWSPTPLSQHRIQAWREVAGQLVSHSPSGTLCLHLVCHTIDEMAITAVLQPLTERAGILKDFDFSLSTNVNLSNTPPALTRKFALPVTFKEQQLVCTKPFRYLDLPAEIQERILANTDLVTPTQELYYNLDGKYSYHVGEADEVQCNSDQHKGVDPRSCTPSRWRIRKSNHRHRPVYGICSQCWAPPQSMMLVSRAIREQAIRVLWRYNRVIVYPWAEWRRIITEINIPQEQQLQLYKLITSGRPSSLLRNLRHLELFLPNVAFHDPLEDTGSDYGSPFSNAVADYWHSTIPHLRDYADVERLTITVNMTVYEGIRDWHAFGQPSPDFYRRGQKSRPVLLLSLQNHIRCLQPLQSLRHMSRFFVRLETLFATSGNNSLDPETQSILLNLRQAEALLEKSVMGEDYDSELLGKSQERPRNWIQTHLIPYDDDLD
ncbi:hypothetical protein F5Y08DRAFT_341871 [Xylaria arbuscula]|nr:hypothetical protein F5Y08DRAFT_341871 [Xylaria arbuscula]